MPGPANALNINQQGTLYFDGVNSFNGIDGSTLGHVLTSNGPGIPPSFLAPTGGSGFSSINIQTFTSSGTYTPSANMVYCIVQCLGGGGAGGGASATSSLEYSTGGGGGAGEYAEGIFSSAAIGASKPVTIGAGGVGSSGSAGGTGGPTSLGALISCNGGAGGTTVVNTDNVSAVGGLGGTGGSGGDFRSAGAAGGLGVVFPISEGWSGAGASSVLGGGAISSSSGGASSALGYGTGGGGYFNGISSSAAAGANGNQGIIIVTEFIQNASDSPYYSLTPYVVGPDANSQFSTIQAAITQAVSDGASSANPKNIYIKQGSYTETLTIVDGINLIGFGGNVQVTELLVSVSGNHTISGNWGAYNIQFNFTNNSIALFSGSGNPFFFNCYVSGSGKGVSDGGSSAFQIIFVESVVTSGTGGICAPITSSASLRAAFFYQSNVNLVSNVFDLTGVASGPCSVSLSAWNSYMYGTTLVDDPNQICSLAALFSFNSRVPMSMSLPVTCQINVDVEGGQLSSNTVSGGDSASSILMTNVRCATAPSVSSFAGMFTAWSGVEIAIGGGAPIVGCEKRYGGGFIGSDRFTAQSGLETTNATPTVIFSIPVAELLSTTLTGTLVGSNTDHTDSIGGTYQITARRASGGNITLVGAAVTSVQSTSTANFSIAVNTSTQAIELTVTGIAATTYNWSAFYQYHGVV